MTPPAPAPPREAPPVPVQAVDEAPPASDAPYAMAQATPSAKPTLPPIATARPLGHISEIHSHLPGGSNIPLNNESSAASGAPLPYVTVMTMAPTAVVAGADADLDDTRFQYLQRTRWMAGIMLAYYLATFFFVQPFMIGAMGIVTGFIGYMSARPPVDFRRIKWVRWYLWLNYGMLGLNLWLLVVTFIAISVNQADDSDDGSDSTSSSGSSWMADPDLASYYTTNLGMYVGVLVGFNMVMHLRGLRTAKLLLAELVAVGFAHPMVTLATVI